MTAALITDDWRVHASIYTDPQIFALEQERLFHGPWLYVAHESEIRHPGDYKTTYLGTQPVVVARGADDGVVRVLLNRCRHRGSIVCHAESTAKPVVAELPTLTCAWKPGVAEENASCDSLVGLPASRTSPTPGLVKLR